MGLFSNRSSKLGILVSIWVGGFWGSQELLQTELVLKTLFVYHHWNTMPNCWMIHLCLRWAIKHTQWDTVCLTLLLYCYRLLHFKVRLLRRLCPAVKSVIQEKTENSRLNKRCSFLLLIEEETLVFLGNHLTDPLIYGVCITEDFNWSHLWDIYFLPSFFRNRAAIGHMPITGPSDICIN